MMSEAEERIRIKVEAALREEWPSARIVHELMLRQGGRRIDLAAITPDRLIVVEVKSERDVLTRLESQLKAACEVADGVIVVVAAKHLDKALPITRPIIGWSGCCAEDDVGPTIRRETHRVHKATCNAPARLEMLWADELRRVSGHRGPREPCIIAAADSLTGAEVRRRVCAALRARPFPRSDDPILSELFPSPSLGRL